MDRWIGWITYSTFRQNSATESRFVAVYALDFSKAFDAVRHATLLEKMAMLTVPDYVYNWFVDLFAGHSHCINFKGEQSDFQQITASIIQGSGLGPLQPHYYVVNAADLVPKNGNNTLVKYADYTYLVVPADSIFTEFTEAINIRRH